MGNDLAIDDKQSFSEDQLKLIISTVAKGATSEELKLFLYRCKNMGLDPLKPGMVHFIKYNNSPGTIVVGIDGFRSRAAQTGKHTGTKRGIIRDESLRCIGAWAEVYRSDWQHPAREEVPFEEYSTGKGSWAKMPETMIKKVAEVAALRMAFPDELGGIYSADEMALASQDDFVPPVVSPNTLSNVPQSGAGGANNNDHGNITEKQQRLLWARKQDAGLSDNIYKALLQNIAGVSTTKDVKWRFMDPLLKGIENEKQKDTNHFANEARETDQEISFDPSTFGDQKQLE